LIDKKIPPLPEGSSMRDVFTRSILARKLPLSRQAYVDAHFLSDDASGEFWRISVRVNALSDVDYGYFIETLRKRVDPMIDAKGVDDAFLGINQGRAPPFLGAEKYNEHEPRSSP